LKISALTASKLYMYIARIIYVYPSGAIRI